MSAASAAVVLCLSTAAVVGAAPAETTVLETFAQPIQKNGQMISVLTDAPTGTQVQVYVNNRLRATTPLRTYSTGDDYITYRRAWGLGTLQLRAGSAVSKRVPMLAAVKLRPYSFRRLGLGGKRMRVTVTAKRYHPGKNAWVKTARPHLQVKRGGWKTIKKIRLNKKGKGVVTFRAPKAFRYRIVVPRTKHHGRTVEVTMGRI